MNAASVSQQYPGRQSALTVNPLVMEYANERLVERLRTRANLSRLEAEALFNDMKMFLAIADNGIKLAPTSKIDFAWHEFILHTRDYAAFCETCVGHFIHHEPLSWEGYEGTKVEAAETARLAESVFGPLSSNWQIGMFSKATCGSGGC